MYGHADLLTEAAVRQSCPPALFYVPPTTALKCGFDRSIFLSSFPSRYYSCPCCASPLSPSLSLLSLSTNNSRISAVTILPSFQRPAFVPLRSRSLSYHGSLGSHSLLLTRSQGPLPLSLRLIHPILLLADSAPPPSVFRILITPPHHNHNHHHPPPTTLPPTIPSLLARCNHYPYPTAPPARPTYQSPLLPIRNT